MAIHNEAGQLGAAVPIKVWKRRFEKLKGMGCNAIRTAHNPADPLILDLMDTMGLLCMDEFFDEWTICKWSKSRCTKEVPPRGYAEHFDRLHIKDSKRGNVLVFYDTVYYNLCYHLVHTGRLRTPEKGISY